LHLKNINESEFENVIKVHINKLLYPLIKQLKESGQTGILSNDSLIDMYSLILKFHLQENKDLMTQFKNDILKGFVIDSNNEKEKVFFFFFFFFFFFYILFYQLYIYVFDIY